MFMPLKKAAYNVTYHFPAEKKKVMKAAAQVWMMLSETTYLRISLSYCTSCSRDYWFYLKQKACEPKYDQNDLQILCSISLHRRLVHGWWIPVIKVCFLEKNITLKKKKTPKKIYLN